jgi:hypothetical protein
MNGAVSGLNHFVHAGFAGFGGGGTGSGPAGASEPGSPGGLSDRQGAAQEIEAAATMISTVFI